MPPQKKKHLSQLSATHNRALPNTIQYMYTSDTAWQSTNKSVQKSCSRLLTRKNNVSARQLLFQTSSVPLHRHGWYCVANPGSASTLQRILRGSGCIDLGLYQFYQSMNPMNPMNSFSVSNESNVSSKVCSESFAARPAAACGFSFQCAFALTVNTCNYCLRWRKAKGLQCTKAKQSNFILFPAQPERFMAMAKASGLPLLHDSFFPSFSYSSFFHIMLYFVVATFSIACHSSPP